LRIVSSCYGALFCFDSAPFHTRSAASSGAGTDDLVLRLGAATAATLVAIAGAQLEMESSLAIFLALITLAGAAVSWWLRRRGLVFGRLTLGRPIWNSLVMLVTMGVVFYFLSDTVLDMVAAYRGEPEKFGFSLAAAIPFCCW
jgi:hypothetical protein